MTKITATLLAVASLPAWGWAQDIDLRNCAYVTRHQAKCELTNLGTEAFRELVYTSEATEADRTYPWGNTGGRYRIPGGVEPNETVTIPIDAPPLPDRANLEKVALSVTARVVDESPAASNAYSGIMKCWNVGALSNAAAMMSISVELEIEATGTPNASSMRLARYRGGDEGAAQQAFEVARRAILMCGREGNLPIGRVILRFDPSVGIVPDS